MFTGIIEEFGKVLKVTLNSIAIECDIVIEDANPNDEDVGTYSIKNDESEK